MSQADELLNSITVSTAELGEAVVGTMKLGTNAYTADELIEEHIVIGDDRYITIPEALKRIAVQYDHDIETVIFDCPRYWDEHDMSKMKIYINYMRPDGAPGQYWAQNVSVDEENDRIIHFNWTISRNVTEIRGNISFLVCAKNVDDEGNEKNHWNSELNEDMYVSEGLECEETILKAYPDIITQLLVRMDYVEEIATPQSMKRYIEEFLTTSSEIPDTIKEYLYSYMATHYPTTEDAVNEYIRMYLDKHPPLIVIGPTKPGVACLWFDTSRGTANTETTTIKLTADSVNDTIYAEVDDETIPGYNFNIL